MKKPILILVIILIVFINLFLFFTGSFTDKRSSPFTYKALEIVLDQNDRNELIVKDVSVKDTYPLHYDNNYSKDFISYEIVDQNNQVLLQGKEMNKDYLMGDLKNSTNSGAIGIFNKSQIIFLLPYYLSANKVIIKDSDSNVKLNINLKDHNLNPGKEVNLCGNGICDSNENFFSCYRDCQIQVSEFFKKSVP